VTAPAARMTGNISEHFAWREARCSCCLAIAVDVLADVHHTAAKLERLRAAAGAVPLRVSSWYRCAQHPIEQAKGPGGRHRHTTGRAVDIRARGAERLRLIERARFHGFRCVGVYPWGVHVDWCDGEGLAVHWIGKG